MTTETTKYKEYYWVCDGVRYPAGVYFKDALGVTVHAWTLYPDGVRRCYTLMSDYRLNPNDPYPLLRERTALNGVQIDDKCYFFDGDVCGKIAGHFAGLDIDDNPQMWAGGGTSFTARDKSTYKFFEPYVGE